METVSVSGTTTIGGSSCGGCSGSGGCSEAIALGGAGACAGGLTYESAIAAPVTVSTAGLVGQNWVDLPVASGFTAIEYLQLATSSKVRLRFNPTRPQLVGSVALPLAGVQSGTLNFTVTTDGGVASPVAVTFTAGQSTPALVALAINVAVAAAGVQPPADGPVARVSGLGVLTLVNPGIGPLAVLTLAAGANVLLGLGTAQVIVEGTSSDTPDIEGLWISQFPRSPNAPVRVQISGVASIDLVVAGRVTA
jgi:hypothetical protein